MLKEQPGCRPAPYLASRGMSWIQRMDGESMDDDALKDYLRESHRLIAAKLPRRVKLEIGLRGSMKCTCHGRRNRAIFMPRSCCNQ